jgi:YspA, cpYpsA-related SLOG family
MTLWRVRIGLACCGVVTHKGRIVRYAPYLTQWCRNRSWKGAKASMRAMGAKVTRVRERSMKVIIAGSRTLSSPFDYDYLCYVMEYLNWPVTEVVSGCARGMDTLGERWAQSKVIPIHLMPPDWVTFGNSAGLRRNAQMADYADALVCIRMEESRGSQDMVRKAKARGLRVREFVIIL